MFCGYCSNEILGNDAFCGKCGGAVDSYAATDVSPQSAASPTFEMKAEKALRVKFWRGPLVAIAGLIVLAGVALLLWGFDFNGTGDISRDMAQGNQDLNLEREPSEIRELQTPENQHNQEVIGVQEDISQPTEQEAIEEQLILQEQEQQEQQEQQNQQAPQAEQLPPLPALIHSIFNTVNNIRLNITWDDGRTTIFDRDGSSSVWVMHRRNGSIRISKTTFEERHGELFIVFPTTEEDYHFFADGTGTFGDDGFFWSFENSPAVLSSVRSASGQTQGFADAFVQNQLLLINIHRHNGEIIAIYRYDNGGWLIVNEGVRSRAFDTIRFTFETDFVVIDAPNWPYFYVIHDNGTAQIAARHEGINASYAFHSWDFSSYGW